MEMQIKMDYIFPDWLAKVLRKPSARTQLEASLVGITLMVIGSLGIAVYFVFFSEVSMGFRILIGISGLGFFLFQSSTLVVTYIQYYTLKKTLGLYPEDYQLKMKLNEAKDLMNDLSNLVQKLGNNGTKKYI